jgi:hypothetical protein
VLIVAHRNLEHGNNQNTASESQDWALKKRKSGNIINRAPSKNKLCQRVAFAEDNVYPVISRQLKFGIAHVSSKMMALIGSFRWTKVNAGELTLCGVSFAAGDT